MDTDGDRVKRYHRSKLLLSALSSVIFLLYAGAWSMWGGRFVAELAAGRWLGLLLFAGVFGAVFELITLPLGYTDQYVLEHRFGLSNQTFTRWLTQTLKGWVVGGLLGAVVLIALYGLLWYGGRMWWWWVWLGWIGLTVALVQLFPVLLLPIFLRSQPLQDEALSGRLRAMASESSLQLSGVYRLDLSTDTKAANAMLAGLGSTRRVYLADTLLDSFTPGEIDVVFAHELGHHTRQHVWKLLALSALLATVRVGVLMYFLHPLRGPEAPRWPEAVAALPTVIFWLAVLELVLKPLRHAVSRRFERQCDRDALRRTADADSYRSALTRLAEMNLADPVPHPVVEWYFYDHPAMCKRLALADTPTESQSQRGSTAT